MTNLMKKIFKSLFIFTIIVASFNVYAYNLRYKANYVDLTNDPNNATCHISAMTQAYEDTIEEYNNRSSEWDSGGWISAAGEYYGTSGGEYTFGTPYYVFYDITEGVPTNYNSGSWNTSGSNSTSNNIYYDTNNANGEEVYIDSNSVSFWNFKGNKATIPEGQGTSPSNLSTYSRVEKKLGNVQLLKWKVTGNGVIISVYELSKGTLTMLKEKYGEQLGEWTKGVRISNVLRTQCSWLDSRKDYIDTPWLWYELTVDNGWSRGGRGFSPIWPSGTAPYKAYATGDYKKGASVANEFDNIMYISGLVMKKVKRQIYINHVDEQGNVISGLQNSYEQMVEPAGENRSNSGPNSGYQEYYTIEGSERIRIRKSDVNKIGDTTYKFIRGEAAAGSSLGAAKSLSQSSKYTWTSNTSDFGVNTNQTDDFVVINMVYSKYTPLNIPLELVGRLEFINRNSEYLGSTTSHDTDYIPATKQLTPYLEGAYPYVVRGIRYESVNETKSSSATIKITIDYSWQYWKFEHHDTTVCTPSSTPGGSPSCGPVCTSACKYYSYTGNSSKSKTYTYAVSYKHTWFDIKNFKMYRISKLELYDDTNNIGGKLFSNTTGSTTYTINPSGTYESRFNSSRGKIDKTLTVTFPSSSYYLSSIHKSASSPGSGKSAAETAAQAALDAVSAKIAADHESLTITYQYDNDYVELDGMTNMLQRNYKTWYERIDKETDSNVRDLDSTKTGTGKINGSALAYTSNLMSYMRPTTRLTSNSDFATNYLTVPLNKENGIRHLRGKVYYNVTTDSKYNVGSNDFDSTDQTYKLNNPYKLSTPDFQEQDREYEGKDVNKVDVLTPINFGNFELITVKKVDHTTGAGNSTILQKNAEFTITPATAGSSTAGYSLSDTREFVKGYYFVFDFNILYNGQQVEAYTPIYLAGANASITAKTTDSFASGSAAQLSNSIKIVAITTNITDLLKARFDSTVSSSYTYIDYLNNKTRTTGVQNQKNLLTRSDIVSDAYHAMYKVITTKNVGRIFDFAVTDCTDLAFKDIFRKPNALNINEPTGVSYYSGYKKWNLYSSEYNEMIDRTDIGSNPQKILPLGPYKHTNTKYVNSPKMGYRISFDLKTTGFMAANNTNNSRRVEITPRYYYISKDGKTFDNNIKLYYKNSSGNYVSFASSGYTIYYKPNDGYRYLRNSMYTDDHTLMSTKLEPLTISSKLILTNKMMSANNTSFIQAWYGEFKLPNSTIAISNVVGNVHNNINKPYTDGYIGVIFDIKCIDTSGFTLSYDTSDKSASSSVNTSQWDYEGFMNFKTPGSAVTVLRYQLEKDIWEIDNSRYQQIKGTVALFDLDNRAANDFE